MKFLSFIVLLALQGCLGLQDQFVEVDNMKEIRDIEDQIGEFGKKKKSIMETIKSWGDAASKDKVTATEDSIKNLFGEQGELNQGIIDRYLGSGAGARVDADYRMASSEDCLADLRASFAPLFDFQAFYQHFGEQNTELEKTLLYNSELNTRVFKMVTALYKQEFVFKRALVQLRSNIQDKKRPDFNIRQFFYGSDFAEEERFIGKRESADVNELYLVYANQKSRFVEEQDIMGRDLQRLKELFEEFYAKVIWLQSFYLQKRRENRLMDFEDQGVTKALSDLFDLRRQIAEIVQVFDAQVRLIQSQREVFDRIFTTAAHIEEILATKSLQEQIATSDVPIDDVLQAEADKKEAEADALEAQKDAEEAVQDAKTLAELNSNRRLIITPQDIELELAQRKEIRRQKAEARQKRAVLRNQRQKDRDQRAEEALQKRLANQNVDGLSPENYFKDKEYTDELDAYSKGINHRIDNDEMTLSDVQNTQISSRVVKQRLSPPEAPPESNILQLSKNSEETLPRGLQLV